LILVDTSVWIDHFRQPDASLASLIVEGRAIVHPFVTGELAVGHLRHWDETIAALRAMLQAKVASEAEFIAFAKAERLPATGLGFVDLHLLASCRITPGTLLWSRDKRLVGHASRLNLAWSEA
jgi:predicted nucleic acid-binding protein